MDDFSTNRHADAPVKPDLAASVPSRHPDLWFSDGNIALVAGGLYFNVHLGLLCRHSEPLNEAINALAADEKQTRLIEGNVVLELDDQPKDLCRFLMALYDGVSGVRYDHTDFESVSALLRLSTKYSVEHIRRDILRGMSTIWPRTLSAWEFREADATDPSGVYKPRCIYPHPILVINLARETNTPELLPSAFYDLSRCSASEIATGYLSPHSSERSELHVLSDEDLMSALKGREHASRFLSTFVVNELEGREVSAGCVHRTDPDPFRKRICQATFESTTFEILRDVNGVVFHRSSDPLFAIMDADLMQTRSDGSGGRLSLLHRACEPCRVEFTSSVDAAREEMWSVKFPENFSQEGYIQEDLFNCSDRVNSLRGRRWHINVSTSGSVPHVGYRLSSENPPSSHGHAPGTGPLKVPAASIAETANSLADQQAPWMKSRPWRSGEPFQHPLPKDGDPWRKCNQLVKDFDDARCERWKDEVQNLLIFAGLFSAVVTAFAVETQRLLQEDPDATAVLLLAQIATQMSQNTSAPPDPVQTTLIPFTATLQSIRINILIFLSLVLSLATVLFGILTLQWIREFQRKENVSHVEMLIIRQVRFEGLTKWKVPQIISLLPVLLQTALVLFFAGLIDFLVSIHQTLAIVVGAVVGLTLVLAFTATILPALQSLYCLIMFPNNPGIQCAYKSPQSWAYFRLIFNPISFLFTTAGKIHREFEVKNSVIENLTQLANADNWSDYDKIWKVHKDADIDAPLAWIATAFTQNLEAVCAIYQCFRDADIGKAWKAYWKIEGEHHLAPAVEELSQKDQELIRDLISEGAVRHFTAKKELRHSQSLMMHHLELYNRATTSGARMSDKCMPCVRLFTPKCPDLSWIEFGSTGAPDIPQEMQLQVLNSLLLKMEGKVSMQWHDFDLFWNVIFRFLQHSSHLEQRILDDVMASLERAIGVPVEGHHRSARTECNVAFFNQILHPLASGFTGPHFQENLADLAKRLPFVRCMTILENYPQAMTTSDREWQIHFWEHFVKTCNFDSSHFYCSV
ncbi:unnamed protein product [Cyclocybe aegerita]|uniref:DUF6535 domain-containing protein n=1 Tax=Cyclocybe aegerita TaxID=1973307 RepID=A0A8S0XF79_CYCAE|nr:unnamed protein product [Cyclocybe aegerita]